MEPLDVVRDVMYFADEYASEYARSYDSLANAERANLSAAVTLALATEMERAATVCDLVAKDELADNGIAAGARECARRIRALIKVEMPNGTA